MNVKLTKQVNRSRSTTVHFHLNDLGKLSKQHWHPNLHRRRPLAVCELNAGDEAPKDGLPFLRDRLSPELIDPGDRGFDRLQVPLPLLGVMAHPKSSQVVFGLLLLLGQLAENVVELLSQIRCLLKVKSDVEDLLLDPLDSTPGIRDGGFAVAETVVE